MAGGVDQVSAAGEAAGEEEEGLHPLTLPAINLGNLRRHKRRERDLDFGLASRLVRGDFSLRII